MKWAKYHSSVCFIESSKEIKYILRKHKLKRKDFIITSTFKSSSFVEVLYNSYIVQSPNIPNEENRYKQWLNCN